jgi:hypothetical protein
MCLLALPMYAALQNQEPNVRCSSPSPWSLQHHFSAAVIESQRKESELFFGGTANYAACTVLHYKKGT